MTSSDEVELFARLRAAGGQRLLDWLADKEQAAVKVMAAGEGAVLHRAQGRYMLLDEIKKLLDVAKNAR